MSFLILMRIPLICFFFNPGYVLYLFLFSSWNVPIRFIHHLLLVPSGIWVWPRILWWKKLKKRRKRRRNPQNLTSWSLALNAGIPSPRRELLQTNFKNNSEKMEIMKLAPIGRSRLRKEKERPKRSLVLA